MNKDQILGKLYEWLITFVEVKHKNFNNFAICPFARKARQEGKVKVTFAEGDLAQSTYDSVKFLEMGSDVVVLCFDHTKITAEETLKIVDSINKHLMPEYVVLEDHPKAVEMVAGVKMNFGECGLFVIAKLAALTEASDALKKAGYYDTWSQSEIDNVVTWRNK